MSSSDSAGRLAELLAGIEVAKAPTVPLEEYIESVYLQKDKIDLETLKAYGCETVVATVMSNIYKKHQHAHFILQIYLNNLEKELGLVPQEEFMNNNRWLFINMNRDALRGDGHSAFNLAYAYFYAICLEQDLTAAISFFELGVKNGHVGSRNCLMNIYKKGICQWFAVGDRITKKWIIKIDNEKYNYWMNYQGK